MKKFLFNVIILTGVSFFLQFSWLVFNIYISQKSGAASMGLYQLVMSVYRFAVTFAVSGIGLTATKLIAAENANVCPDICGVMKKLMCYAAFFGMLAQIIIISAWDFLGRCVLGDERTVKALKIIGITLPFISLSACIGGYFTAEGKIFKYSFCQILEQVIRMTISILLLEKFSEPTAENTCTAIFSGGCIGEFVSFLAAWYFYTGDNKSVGKTAKHGSRVVKTALPLAVSSYVRSGLNSAQQILIPPGFIKYGMTRKAALEKYGAIHGMAMPVIMFASAFLYSAASLIVPELSKCAAEKNEAKIDRIVTKNFDYTMIFSVFVAIFMLIFGDLISETVYKSGEIAIYIKLLAPLIVVMYLDSSVDGMLKGLNEQVRSMEYNIIDSAVSLVLVCILIPKMGLAGYIAVIFISEILNAVLSILRLIKITDFKIKLVKNVIMPIAFASVAAGTAKLLCVGASGYVGLCVTLLVSGLFYGAMMQFIVQQKS